MAIWSDLGSQVIYAALHGNPFLGSPWPPHAVLAVATDGTNLNPQPSPWLRREIFEPEPSPWARREIGAAASLLSVLSLGTAAAKLPNSPQKSALVEGLNGRVDVLIDDYCGTPPGQPWPGPPPFAYALAAGLSYVAATLEEGALQAAVLDVSTRILDRTIKGAAR
jgi:hypothetical protein